MKRILVIGCGGSGKTTFSQKLSTQNNLPVLHLDTIYWTKGWIEEKQDIFEQKLQNWLEQDEWIIDGNFHRTLPKRLQYADTVFFLDFSTWRSLYGAIKRLIRDFGKTRTDMAQGCKEGFDLPFLLYILKFRKKTRPSMLTALKEHGESCKIIIFNNHRQTEEWLSNALPNAAPSVVKNTTRKQQQWIM